MRILVVDDDPPLLEVLGDFLTLEGYTTQLAETREAALAALQAQPFDLILSDPMGRGWDPALPFIRQLQATAPTTPVVVVTAYGEAARLPLESARISALWLKPMDIEALVSSLHQLVETS